MSIIAPCYAVQHSDWEPWLSISIEDYCIISCMLCRNVAIRSGSSSASTSTSRIAYPIRYVRALKDVRTWWISLRALMVEVSLCGTIHTPQPDPSSWELWRRRLCALLTHSAGTEYALTNALPTISLLSGQIPSYACRVQMHVADRLGE